MQMPQIAALLFVVASCVVGAFQMALALGAPWGEFTLGGRWRGRLPLAVRLIPLLSVVLLVFFCAVVLARARLALPQYQSLSQTLVWFVVGYCALGSIANVATPSKRERNVWLPVVLFMLASSLVVAVTE